MNTSKFFIRHTIGNSTLYWNNSQGFITNIYEATQFSEKEAEEFQADHDSKNDFGCGIIAVEDMDKEWERNKKHNH